MLKFFAVSILSIIIVLTASGQHPLVGAWKMISIKGIGAEGERFYYDTTSVTEIKIITPTHYMLIAHDVAGDSLVFNRAYVGKIRIEGNSYLEIPLYSSLPIFENVKSNFTWRVEGDKFIQAGTFTRPDGKTVTLHELVFLKIKAPYSYPDNPVIGTWNQLSSVYTDFEGDKYAHTQDTRKRLHIITPTHWMRFNMQNGKFESAMMGTYTITNGKTYPMLQYASFPFDVSPNVVMTEQLKDGKLFVSGVMTSPDKKKFLWDDIFEPVNSDH
jgi:hypothetical protein